MSNPIVGKFKIYRGTAPTLRWTVKTAAGAIVDLTGWTARWTARKMADSPDPPMLSEEATGFGGAVPGGTGIFEVKLSKAKTLLLSAGEYATSLERTNEGSEDLLARDDMTVEFDILNAR